jgi:hypothetical protein
MPMQHANGQDAGFVGPGPVPDFLLGFVQDAQRMATWLVDATKCMLDDDVAVFTDPGLAMAIHSEASKLTSTLDLIAVQVKPPMRDDRTKAQKQADWKAFCDNMTEDERLAWLAEDAAHDEEVRQWQAMHGAEADPRRPRKRYWFTMDDIVRRAGVSLSTVRNWINKPHDALPVRTVREGRRNRFFVLNQVLFDWLYRHRPDLLEKMWGSERPD